MIAFAQVLCAVNLVQTLRGAERRPASERDNMLFAVEGMIAFLAVLLAIGAGIGGFFLGRSTAGGGATAVPTTSRPTTSAPAGAAIFKSAGCGGCHTLAAAGAHGTVGPNLDTARPPAALVVDRVSHGKGGMPSFAGQLSNAQIRAVAAFVAGATAK